VDVIGESKAAFKLRLPPHWHIHSIFHASLLDPYWANKIGGREQPLPKPPEIVNGELEYEVDAVLDSRIRRNKLQYLVGWKGYGLEERTWEPAENLENAKEAVAAFHLRHPNRPSATDREGPKPRRSSPHRRGGTVMNDSEPRKPHMSPASPASPMSPGTEPRPGDRTGSGPMYIKFSHSA